MCYRFPQPYLYILLICILWASCKGPISPVYQDQNTIPNYKWDREYDPAFRFSISDTLSGYNVYFLIRHTSAYPFSNIWLNLKTIMPGDTTGESTRIEVPLAEKSGKWLGRGMGEIWEHRMPLTRDDRPMKFSKPGTYTILIAQDMRMNPLPEVLQIGLRIERRGSITK